MTDQPPQWGNQPPPPRNDYGQPQWGEGPPASQQQPYQLTPKQMKAAAKAGRPWYQKKRIIIPGILVALIIAATAAGSGDEDDTVTPAASVAPSVEATSSSAAAETTSAAPTSAAESTTEATKPVETKAAETKAPAKPAETKAAALYPGRTGAAKGDKEAKLGQAVELSGYTTVVTSAKFMQKLSVIEEDGYLVAHVTILNRDKEAQSYNQFQFKVQTPDGQVLDSTFTSAEGALGTGDLISGGKTEGDVIFKIGKAKGQFFILYVPDIFSDTDRGVWGVKI